ncbi:protease [Intrasporangium oryzae NRRL B-24470]|uniref:Protease n=1 Tax=Intrasporangium oryzae NRRL B-24470 TaxID=1386089 RepID=W9G6S5_9MICO|nr:pitrilysin family protein [Intrasporangium oryzae]EWT00498.1 protease [Intrasporangium oryzae NRRL B-24470]
MSDSAASEAPNAATSAATAAAAATAATTTVPRPAVAPPEPWSFPVGTTHDLPNGLRLVTYDVPGQYVLSVRLGLPISLRDEPQDREGVATIMARTLDEGTAQHSAEELARLLERKGVSYGAGMSDAGLSVDLDVVKGNLEPALDLLRQILTEPVFPEAEVARQVRTRLAEIEQERSVAAQRAGHEFVRTFYARDDRSSRPTGGAPETVSAITREDVSAFHARHVVASGVTMVVAGDLEGVDVLPLVEATLGGWRQGPSRDRFLQRPAQLAPDRSRIVLVDRPGSVQTELVIGAPGPDRSVDGGWAPYPVIGFVLGGSPNARIDAVLREEKGYTYGIRSSFRPRRAGGLFLTSGSVRADSTAESLRLLVEILDSGRNGFSDKEIRSGVDFISKTAPGRYATADAIADEAISMALDGRTTKFTTANLRDLAAVDRSRADGAYERFADAAGLGRGDTRAAGWTIVLVGDAGDHREAIEGLGLGEVTVVSDAG